MALTTTLVSFTQFKKDQVGNGLHNFDTDTFKYAFIVDSVGGGIDLSEVLQDPAFGPSRVTDLSLHEVSAGGSYPAGGVTVTNMTSSIVDTDVVISSDDIQIVVDAANPTDGVFGLLYNDTHPDKPVVAYVTHSDGVVDLTNGTYDYLIPAGGWIQGV